jgi:hypothetical protein
MTCITRALSVEHKTLSALHGMALAAQAGNDNTMDSHVAQARFNASQQQ